MSKNSYKVIQTEENELFNSEVCNRLKSALILKYSNPLVSLPFLKDSITLEEGKQLGQMACVNFNEDGCYDKNGILLDSNFILMTIVNDLTISAKNALEKDEDSGYYLANLVKGIVSSKVLPKINKVDNETMSVDDLMAKLYGEKQELKEPKELKEQEKGMLR